MANINIVRVYNLVNSKGKRLALRLGVLPREQWDKFNGDTGYRWSFLGTEIPMPVRAGTWFNGFPVDTMTLWLAEHEWYVETEVDMATGKTKVHVLPEPVEEYHDYQLANDQMEFNKLIKEMCANGKKLNALYIYRYAHEVGTRTALTGISAICSE